MWRPENFAKNVQIVRDWRAGMRGKDVALKHGVTASSVSRLIREAESLERKSPRLRQALDEGVAFSDRDAWLARMIKFNRHLRAEERRRAVATP